MRAAVTHTEVYATGTGLGEGEGEDGVALFGGEFAVAACSDDQILFAVQRVGHGSSLASGGEFEGPEFGASFGIERVNFVVHCGGGEDEAASGGDGTAESNGSGVLVGNE